jgi:PAS domain S-box-containing protein
MKTRENIRSEYFRELEKLRETLNQSRSELVSEKLKLSVLMEISVGLFEAKSFKDIGKSIEESLIKMIPESSLGFKLGVYEKEKYRTVYSSEKDFSVSPDRFYKFSELGNYTKTVVDSREMVIIQDNHSKESLKIDPAQINREPHSMMFVPFFFHDSFIGLISFANKPANSFDSNMIAILETISKYVALAVEKLLLDNSRQSREDAIRESELRYKKLFLSIADYIYSVFFENGEPVRTVYGEGTLAVTGYSIEEFLQDDFLWIKIVYPDDRERVLEKIKMLSSGFQIPSFKHRIITKDGRIKWVSNTTVIHFSDDGRILSYDGMIRDITEKKEFNWDHTGNEKGNDDLRKSRELYELLLEKETYLIGSIDVTGKLVDISNSWLMLLGYTREELIDSSLYNLIYSDDKEKFEGLFTNELLLRRNQLDKIIRILGKNGSLFWLDSNLKTVDDGFGNIDHVLMFARNITEEKTANSDKIKLLEWFKLAFDVTEDAAYDWNFETREVYFSDNYFVMLGYEVNEFQINYESFRKLLHFEDRDRLDNFIKYIIDNRLPSYEIDFRLKCKNGSYKWILGRGKIVEFNQKGEPVRMIGTHTDITERKNAEEYLKINEEKYRTLFDTMMQGVVYHDSEGRIISMNRAAEEILGIDFHRLMNITTMDPSWNIIHEDGTVFIGYDHPAMVSLRTGRQVSDVIMGIFNHAVNKYKWVILNSVPLFRKGELKPYQVYATITDVTELHETRLAFSETEAKFKILFNSMNEGVALHEIIYKDGKSINYRILDVNPMYEKIIGITKEMVSNKLATEVYGTKEAPYLEIYTSVAETGNSHHFETYFDKMGKHFYISVVSYERSKFSTVFFDITEMKKIENNLKRSEEKFRLVVNQLPSIVWTLDRDLKYTMSVGSDLSKLGLKPNQIVGMDLMKYLNISDTDDKLYRYHLRALQGKSVNFEMEIKGLLLQTNLEPLKDINGEIIGVIGISYDISDRKRKETE